MARTGYRIFDADTHIIEPAERIEPYLTAAERAKLAALGPLIERAPAKAGMSRYRIGKRPALNRRLGGPRFPFGGDLVGATIRLRTGNRSPAGD
jgi:hypothetical protein